MEKEFNSKIALLLAGKLAIAADKLLICELKNIYNEITNLKVALHDYNEYIFQYPIKESSKP